MTSAFQSGNGEPLPPPQRGHLMPDAIAIPAEILARHRARVLDPATAVRPKDGTRPLSTVYRVRHPARAGRRRAGALARIRTGPTRTRSTGSSARSVSSCGRPPRRTGRACRQAAGDLGVPVPLVRRADRPAERAPDPWAALTRPAGRARRAGAALRPRPPADVGVAHGRGRAGEPRRLGRRRPGVPRRQPGRRLVALYTGSRNPVAMLMPQPARPAATTLAGGRRPVVAVLDTGIGPHPWWNDQDPADPIIEVSQDVPGPARRSTRHAGQPDRSRRPLNHPYEEPNEFQPLLGLIDSHSGHGTFVVRSGAPAVPGREDPVAAGAAQRRLLHRGLAAARAQLAARAGRSPGSRTRWSTSCRCRSASTRRPPTRPRSCRSLAVIERLTSQGVLVVAAAGNDATTRPVHAGRVRPGHGRRGGRRRAAQRHRRPQRRRPHHRRVQQLGRVDQPVGAGQRAGQHRAGVGGRGGAGDRLPGRRRRRAVAAHRARPRRPALGLRRVGRHVVRHAGGRRPARGRADQGSGRRTTDGSAGHSGH